MQFVKYLSYFHNRCHCLMYKDAKILYAPRQNCYSHCFRCSMYTVYSEKKDELLLQQEPRSYRNCINKTFAWRYVVAQQSACEFYEVYQISTFFISDSYFWMRNRNYWNRFGLKDQFVWVFKPSLFKLNLSQLNGFFKKSDSIEMKKDSEHGIRWIINFILPIARSTLFDAVNVPLNFNSIALNLPFFLSSTFSFIIIILFGCKPPVCFVICSHSKVLLSVFLLSKTGQRTCSSAEFQCVHHLRDNNGCVCGFVWNCSVHSNKFPL